MKKTTRRPQSAELTETWYLVDAKGKVLGRLATAIATALTGKNQPNFDPSVPNKVKVVVINASQIKVTGLKAEQKEYYHHTGYLGGLKTTTYAKLLEKDPADIIRRAVSGMLPKNKLRDLKLNDLKVYADDKHLHAAQKPVKLEL